MVETEIVGLPAAGLTTPSISIVTGELLAIDPLFRKQVTVLAVLSSLQNPTCGSARAAAVVDRVGHDVAEIGPGRNPVSEI